ncbi:MAG: Gfo/Idh/MocA family oxidoreductase [Actinobacteria bacterium]|nr:Gfo/Idh/MocA family oxidoreductase [Actinomycetota bacterium]
MAETLRLAFVGCGAIARRHLDGIHAFGDRVHVTAAIDPDLAKAQRIAGETGAAVFGSLTEALAAGGFEAVDIMVPHDLHEALAIEALRAGQHVLLEKPMAPTLEACQRILAAARAAGTVFMVAENAQYWPEIVKAADLIAAGAIGNIITARAAFTHRLDETFFGDARPWRFERARTGGGITIDGGSHWIRPLRMWLGEIDAVVAVTGHPLRQMEGESLVRSVLRFASGQIATFDALMHDGPMAPEPWWRVTGTRGELLIEGGHTGGLQLYDTASPAGRRVAEPQGYAKSFGPEIDDFASAVLHGTPLRAAPEQSLGELRTAFAIYRSAASGRWEKVWA